MQPVKIYRVGIVGFGFIGKVHAFAYQTLPFYYDPLPLAAKIQHIVTSRQETAERARQLVNAEFASTDYRDVTENPEIDIVHVCTPNHLHKDALISAIEHGKHIYCDKPLVASWDDAQEVLQYLDDYQGVAQMTFQNRFFPATIRARQLIDEGAIGNILGFRVAYLHGGSADPEAPLKWKLSAGTGGGVIADLGSHVLDLLEHLAGPIDKLTASTHVAYADRPSLEDPARRVAVDAEDSVIALARLRSGGPGTIEATKIATGTEDELRLELHGSRGALRLNLMDPHHLGFYDRSLTDHPSGGVRGWSQVDTGQRFAKPATSFPSPKAAVGWIRSHVACLANFLQAIRTQCQADPDLRQGIRVQRLMHALRISSRQGNWIELID